MGTYRCEFWLDNRCLTTRTLPAPPALGALVWVVEEDGPFPQKYLVQDLEFSLEYTNPEDVRVEVLLIPYTPLVAPPLAWGA